MTAPASTKPMSPREATIQRDREKRKDERGFVIYQDEIDRIVALIRSYNLIGWGPFFDVIYSRGPISPNPLILIKLKCQEGIDHYCDPETFNDPDRHGKLKAYYEIRDYCDTLLKTTYPPGMVGNAEPASAGSQGAVSEDTPCRFKEEHGKEIHCISKEECPYQMFGDQTVFCMRKEIRELEGRKGGT